MKAKQLYIVLFIFILSLVFSSCSEDDGFEPLFSFYEIEIPENVTIRKILFVDNYTGYLLGQNFELNYSSIYKTDNGGETWFRILETDALIINDIHFHNFDLGYICGERSTVMKSEDGGYNWEVIAIDNLNGGDDPVSYHQIISDGNDNLFLAGAIGEDDGVFSRKTSTEGFIHQYFETPLLSFTYLSDYVFFFGAENFVILTEDGGNVFYEIEFYGKYISQIVADSFNNIYFISPKHGLFISSDLGFNWHRLLYDWNSEFYCLSFGEAFSLVCGSDGLMFASYDGAINWKRVRNAPPVNFNSSFIKSNHEIFLGSDNGKLYWVNRRRSI